MTHRDLPPIPAWLFSVLNLELVMAEVFTPPEKPFHIWTNGDDWVIAQSADDALVVMAGNEGYKNVGLYCADYPDEEWLKVDPTTSLTMRIGECLSSDTMKNMKESGLPMGRYVTLKAPASEWLSSYLAVGKKAGVLMSANY
jgi:hypothetical protein